MRSKTKTIIALSIIPQIAIVKLLSNFPQFIELFYSRGIYVWISKAMRLVFGWIPFSVGDILYTLAAIYLIRWLWKNWKRVFKETKLFVRDIFVVISLTYFSFHMLWGFNYYREPLHETLGLGYKYNTQELIMVTDLLVKRANDLHEVLETNDTIKISMPYTKSELLKKVRIGYDKLGDELPNMDPLPISLKRSIYSVPLTYMGFGGYLNPFTNEAQIDGIVPIHKYPSTGSHELAHQIGYAAENEANFIGYLACLNHPDPYFKYSGAIFGLKYCLIELARRDENAFEKAREQIRPGILSNYDEKREFWLSYQNPLEPFFKETFDTFLKANSQSQGIESYSYVVALIVNFKKEQP